MALPNVYYLLDDSGTSAGSAGSGMPLCPEFTAPTPQAAIVAGYILATALQRNARIVPKFGAPPYTLIAAGPANVALTSVPSGINSP